MIVINVCACSVIIVAFLRTVVQDFSSLFDVPSYKTEDNIIYLVIELLIYCCSLYVILGNFYNCFVSYVILLSSFICYVLVMLSYIKKFGSIQHKIDFYRQIKKKYEENTQEELWELMAIHEADFACNGFIKVITGTLISAGAWMFGSNSFNLSVNEIGEKLSYYGKLGLFIYFCSICLFIMLNVFELNLNKQAIKERRKYLEAK